MRRLLVIPVLVLGLAAGNALGASHKATEAGTVGKISALSPTSISVDGKHHDLTCRVGERSPDVTGFAVGDRVAIVCRDHRLRKLVRLPDAATATGTVRVLGTHVIHVDGDGDHDRTCRITDASPDVDEVDVGDKVSIACADGVLVKVAHASAAPEAKTGSGAITALGNGSITIKGEHVLTCTLTGDSPVPATFKVGDQVGIACVDGVLVKIVRLPQPAGSNDGSGKDGTTTATTPTVNLYATGSITALTDGAIAIHGDRDTSCTRGPSSPKLGDYKLGDRVRIACTNGVLAGIARADLAASPPPPAASGSAHDDADRQHVRDGLDHRDHRRRDRDPRRPRHDLHARPVLAEARRLQGRRQGDDRLRERCPGGHREVELSAAAASAPASSRADGQRLLRRARSRRSRTARSASTATTTRPARAARPRRSSATTRSATG